MIVGVGFVSMTEKGEGGRGKGERGFFRYFLYPLPLSFPLFPARRAVDRSNKSGGDRLILLTAIATELDHQIMSITEILAFWQLF